MDFGALTPEINSGRMYAGSGSGPMLAAAAAWDGLGAQLHSTAAVYSCVISGLVLGWQGPAAAMMAATAAPYLAWMDVTAAQAEQTAAQARSAATAYEAAFAATVPPPVVAANRTELASLVATNIFGQNTPAIAATEALYADMWAQDATAMYGYAGSSAIATQLTPFTAPPQTTNPNGLAAQSAAVSQAAGTSVGTGAQSVSAQLMSQVPSSLQSLAAPVTPNLPPLATLLEDIAPLVAFLEVYEFTGPATVPARNGLVNSTLGFGLSTRGFQTGELPVPLVPGLDDPPLAGPGWAELRQAPAPASAGMTRAGAIGALSVPPSWAAATPMVRLAATALQDTSSAAAALAAETGEPGLFAQLAAASLVGSAFGGAVPRVITGTRGQAGNSGPGPDRDGKTSEKLKRVLAELSQKPESVQHWHTDKANLDDLLEQLSAKPGLHAVHVSSNNQSKVTPPRPRWG